MPTVGSSSTMRSGSGTTASANSTRWRWPPESVLTMRPARSAMPASSSARATVSGVACIAAMRCDDLAHRDVAEQPAGLHHRPDPAGAHGRRGSRSNTRTRAGVGLAQAEQHLDRGGLAGAVGPEQRHDLAGSDDEVDAVDGGHVTEGLAQAAQGHRGAARGRAGAGARSGDSRVLGRHGHQSRRAGRAQAVPDVSNLPVTDVRCCGCRTQQLSSPAAQQPTSRCASQPCTASRPTRSWAIVSRSRTVTAWSSRVSKSTVTQNGVPISSWRR